MRPLPAYSNFIAAQRSVGMISVVSGGPSCPNFDSDHVALRDWMGKETIPQVLQAQGKLYCLSLHDTSSPDGSQADYCKIDTATNLPMTNFFPFSNFFVF
jgi:hypothetical protein